MGLKIFFTILLVLLNGFFVAAEFSLIRVRMSAIEIKAKEGSRLAKLVLSILHNLYGYLSATQLGVTIASLLLGAVGEEVTTELIKGAVEKSGFVIAPATAHTLAVVVGLIIITILHVLFGELFPKALAIQRSEPVSMALALPLRVFYYITLPLTWFLSKASNLMLGLIGITNLHGTEAHTSDELRLLLDQSKESGEIQDSEHELIENVFQFNDRMVKQIMVPRTKLSALDVNAPADQILDTIFAEGYSRLPVYEGNIDNIVGVLNVKDLLPIIRRRRARGAGPHHAAALLRARNQKNQPPAAPVSAQTHCHGRRERRVRRRLGHRHHRRHHGRAGGRNPGRVRQRSARSGKSNRGRVPREPGHAHLRRQRVPPLPPCPKAKTTKPWAACSTSSTAASRKWATWPCSTPTSSACSNAHAAPSSWCSSA